jgi:hypothetical protein
MVDSFSALIQSTADSYLSTIRIVMFIAIVTKNGMIMNAEYRGKSINRLLVPLILIKCNQTGIYYVMLNASINH